jgi:hypothetical protein
VERAESAKESVELQFRLREARLSLVERNGSKSCVVAFSRI